MIKAWGWAGSDGIPSFMRVLPTLLWDICFALVYLAVVFAIGWYGRRLWEERNIKQGGGGMKVTDFALKVAKKEGKKMQVNIAQIKEILRVINDLTKGKFYRMIWDK